jgi:hypothetical protein
LPTRHSFSQVSRLSLKFLQLFCGCFVSGDPRNVAVKGGGSGIRGLVVQPGETTAINFLTTSG